MKLGCVWELEKVVKEVLGDEMIMTRSDQEDFINTLLEDKDIVDATNAYEVSKDIKDEAAWMAARHTLFLLLGKAKASYVSNLINMRYGKQLVQKVSWTKSTANESGDDDM